MKTTSQDQSKRPSTELYAQSENYQELLDQLRDHYISYKEYAMRCHVELKTSGKLNLENLHNYMRPEEAHKSFYFPPKIPLLEEPEKQKIYRKKLVQEIGSLPEPEPLILIADVLQQNAMETIGDRSNPSIVKNDLALFYKRRAAYLQHKKYKILNRWSNKIMSSEYIDKTGIQLDQCIGRLQKELDLTFNRIDRLTTDDSYNPNGQIPRPHPTAREENDKQKPLYIESDSISINSAIRQDDVETYLRIQTYRNKIFRLGNKLAADLKWLPYSGRFDIWGESRALLMDFKARYFDRQFKVYQEIARKIKKKLETNGVIEERVVNAIIDKFTKHLKGEEFQTRADQIMNSHKSNHEQPPIIISNNIELKMMLIDIAKEFGITGDLEIDNGHSFTYQVSVYYPTHFQKQVLLLQFDWYDTGKETDQDTLEKIARNVGMSKTQITDAMSRFSELERNKSILGKINIENDITQKLQNEKNQENKGANDANIGFFSLDETDCKLQKANWLDGVCFQGTVSETIKKQSHVLNQVSSYDSLLESAFNFLDVNDGGAVNKILEDSSLTHVQRAAKRNQLRQENQKFMNKEDEIESNLKIAIQRVDQFQDQIAQAEQPLIEPIPSHIVKAYYTLRYLKSRDYKIKLLHVLNYYRSLQKRFSLDLKEFCSRERVVGDLELINPQFGKDQNGNLRNMSNGNNGPGNIFQHNIGRKLDDPTNDPLRNHPISLKALKYNMMFNPQVSSTCPCVPRYHVAFGRPRLYEEVSENIDKNHYEINPNREAKKYLGRQDKIVINESDLDITIYDEYGIKIIYEESLNDLLQIEEELIKVGTYYVNQNEFLIDPDMKEPANAIDRGEMALHLIQKEHEYQFQKVLLIEQFIETYEHTCDPLEQIRLVQIISDIMVQRPRLNLQASYFLDSYANELEVLKQKREMIIEVMDYQKEIEEEENEEVRKFQELKFRKIQDHMNQEWLYKENKARIEKAGSKEEEAFKAPVTESVKSRLEQKGIIDPDKRQRMKEIAQRHITEFANNQYMDFQDVLGLPEVTAEELYNKQGQKEPIIIDALREHGYFSKQMDGYPWYFSRAKQKLELFGIEGRRIGLLDFYESFSIVTRITAAQEQSFEELIRIHTPEHGMAASCLERALLYESRGKFRQLRSLIHNEETLVTKSKNIIEDDFYLANSDKLMFLMREFKSHLCPEQIFDKANPLLVSKLDIDSVSKFDFPRIKPRDLNDIEELSQDEIMKRMIDLAKISITGQTQEEKLIGGNLHVEDFLEKRGNSKLPEVVNAPSLMQMCCNLIEVLRLREELIQRIHETDTLSIIYKAQLKQVNKDSFKLIQTDSINFDTQQIIKDSLNMIDNNDGCKLELDLPFREFDNSLRTCLNFRSESCIKELFLDLGVEELRAILHYQVMQQQILQVAVMTNQLIMDGPLKGLYELEFLTKKRQFTVPNPIINLSQILSKSGDGYNIEMFNRERNKLRQNLQREVGDFVISINSKKAKHRPFILKRYSNVFQKVLTYTHKPEVKLRILRSYRIKLLHHYCKDVLKDAYHDSQKIQLLLTCNQIRIRSQLLPKDSNVFFFGQSEIIENIPYSFTLSTGNFIKDSVKVNISLLLNNKFDTLFYVPSTDEIMNLESRIDDQKEQMLQNQVQFTDIINEDLMDKQVKDMVKLPTKKIQYKVDEGLTRNFRKVSFNEAYQYNSQSFKLLNYMTLINRIFMLEYIMGRNNSPGLDVLELENQVLTGRPYWDKSKEFEANPEYKKDESISDRVINRIVSQRRARIDLSEDLNYVSERLQIMNHWPRKFTIENLKLENMIELLNLQHHVLYNRFLYGLEGLLDTYLGKKNDECFEKLIEVKGLIQKKSNGIRMYENGFNMDCLNVHSRTINISDRYLTDNDEYEKMYKPIIDEDQLMPMEIQMVRGLFSQNTYIENQYLETLNKGHIRDYAQLEVKFIHNLQIFYSTAS